MKFLRTILALLLLLLFSEVIAQSYIAFPDSAIIWRQTSIRYVQGTTTLACWDNQFELRGEDTIINNLTYSKLYWSGLAGANGICNLYSVTNQNNWAIREDSTKRVYIFDYISGQEFLLYDFNLGLYDTLAYGYAFSFNGTYDNYVEVISSIDSLLINGLYHKVYHITSTNWMGVVVDYVQIIEGLGSTFGLFADISPNWSEKYDYLNCVYINGQVVYLQTQPCSLLTSDPEIFHISNILNIYPNPVTSTLNIRCNNCQSKISEFRLLNLLGENVMSGAIEISKIESKIDLSKLDNGTYILKIDDHSNSEIFKITKVQ